jgi:two-component system, OmpR family, sensor histidine kinase KdpD
MQGKLCVETFIKSLHPLGDLRNQGRAYASPMTAMEFLVYNRISRTEQYLYSLGAVLVVAVACFFLSGVMGYRVAAFILLLTVSMLAILFDILPVLLAALLSAFLWDFFFIPPRFALHVETTEDTILLIMYFVIALINGVLTYKIRQIEKAARLKEERAASVKLYNTLLNSLSHELRTPIATILGAADNLQGNTHLSNANKEDLITEIGKAALRLNQQVENLLNLSRLESGHIQPKNDWCDVTELVHDTVKRVEDNNPHRHIRISVNPDLPLCYLDMGMLEQVIYNLLNNAAIHTDPAATIEITVMCHTDLLHITVEDTGEGFKNVNPEEVFHKFSRQGQQKETGSGLGLSIAKGFTEALGGTIHLENKKSGAMFTIYLPVKASLTKTDVL